MGKKTIGSFIAALRKANGMTQKDLAEKLHVSDKTVSRWERDEGTPDLSLIPVIAEIFQVTCDELLRGERKPPEERSEAADSAETSQKGEQQRRRILEGSFNRYQNQSCIAMGIAGLGMFVALICFVCFRRDILGFFLGTICFVAAAVCQAVFMNNAFYSMSGDDVENEDILFFRRRVIMLAEKSFGLAIGLSGASLLLLFRPARALGTWLVYGSLFAAAALVIYICILYFLNASMLKKRKFGLPEKEEKLYWENHHLKRNIAIVLVIALAVTVAIHVGIINLQADADLDNFMLWEGLTMASFVLYPGEILTAILVYRKRRKK